MSVWFGTLLTLMLVRPNVDLDLERHGVRAMILGASFGVFLLGVFLVQRQMGLPAGALTFGAPQRLETAGVFRLTRNPIYTLFLLPIVALSVYSVMAAILAAIAYVAAMNKWVIVPEEQALAEHFGLEYQNYASRTPRWLVRRAA